VRRGGCGRAECSPSEWALPTVEEIEAELSEMATQRLALEGPRQPAATRSKTTRPQRMASTAEKRTRSARKR
jgi:hypothetical protein